jgi:hypothetical protein
MRRSWIMLLIFLLAGTAVFLAGRAMVSHYCAAHMGSPADELDWLRTEFSLSDAELARVRQLHAGYLPVCQAFCERIEARQSELQAMLKTATNAPAATEAKLAEIAMLRAQCQANMLRHFREVSQAMPPEQGRRYLAEMQRLTMGAHEQIEKGMSASPAPAHEHP